MCGIIAYIGKKKGLRKASEVLLKGLKRLEYRGYDSAGIGVIQDDGTVSVVKKVGKVINLDNAIQESNSSIQDATLGIAHTRWATHGPPSDRNSHPHTNSAQTVCVVHNGIIENYTTLKQCLQQKGYEFCSDTDTEVLTHLIDEIRTHSQQSFQDIVRLALCQVKGTFGVCFIDAQNPDVLIGARQGAQLILGIGEDEFFIASDAAAIVEHTRKVVYLEDGDIITITRGQGRQEEIQYEISNLNEDRNHQGRIETLELSLTSIEKAGYKHFMLKEILEQPQVLRNCLRGRVNSVTNLLQLGGILRVMDKIVTARRLIICACGTSWHSGLIGEYLIEDLARIPVEVEYASEFRYRKPILYPDDVVIVISQSGETADTLAAVCEAKRQGCLTIGFVNSVGSTIARETDAGCYLHVGPEIGVASTKAFTGQLMILTVFALMLAKHKKTLPEEKIKEYLKVIENIPDHVTTVLQQCDKIADLSRVFKYAQNFMFMGRGYQFPVALEGALKLKEISYIHAEGYPAAEMKHGPLALIDQFMPVIIIAPKSDPTYEKTKANIEEVIARQGSVICITEEGNHELDEQCEHVIYVPQVPEPFAPILTIIPLQLMSYYIADLCGCSVDQPRNLAKSVTVECMPRPDGWFENRRNLCYKFTNKNSSLWGQGNYVAFGEELIKEWCVRRLVYKYDNRQYDNRQRFGSLYCSQ